jgi:hypothetical protein
MTTPLQANEQQHRPDEVCKLRRGNQRAERHSWCRALRSERQSVMSDEHVGFRDAR